MAVRLKAKSCKMQKVMNNPFVSWYDEYECMSHLFVAHCRHHRSVFIDDLFVSSESPHHFGSRFALVVGMEDTSAN